MVRGSTQANLQSLTSPKLSMSSPFVIPASIRIGVYLISSAASLQSRRIQYTTYKDERFKSMWSLEPRGNAFIIGNDYDHLALCLDEGNFVQSSVRSNAQEQRWVLHLLENADVSRSCEPHPRQRSFRNSETPAHNVVCVPLDRSFPHNNGVSDNTNIHGKDILGITTPTGDWNDISHQIYRLMAGYFGAQEDVNPQVSESLGVHSNPRTVRRQAAD